MGTMGTMDTKKNLLGFSEKIAFVPFVDVVFWARGNEE